LSSIRRSRSTRQLELIIAGESYGGHYTPFTARKMLEYNAYKFNLKAIAIGNGWVDATAQYLGYTEFAGQFLNSFETRDAACAVRHVCALALAPGP
jgi:carboxypeptidase C (cathepsin A)